MTRSLLTGDLVKVPHFVRDFLAAADLPLQFALASASGSNLYGERVAGTEPSQFLSRLPSGWLTLQCNDGVACMQARMIGFTTGRHRSDRHGTVEISGPGEASSAARVWDGGNRQAARRKETIP